MELLRAHAYFAKVLGVQCQMFFLGLYVIWTCEGRPDRGNGTCKATDETFKNKMNWKFKKFKLQLLACSSILLWSILVVFFLTNQKHFKRFSMTPPKSFCVYELLIIISVENSPIFNFIDQIRTKTVPYAKSPRRVFLGSCFSASSYSAYQFAFFFFASQFAYNFSGFLVCVRYIFSFSLFAFMWNSWAAERKKQKRDAFIKNKNVYQQLLWIIDEVTSGF